MTGGVTANYTYKEVEGRFDCTLEFGEQVLTSLARPNKENGEANSSHQIPNEGSGVDINGCAVIRCTRPNICVIATMLHMARDRSWMFCSKVVVVPMDRQFEVLPIMSAWDYVTRTRCMSPSIPAAPLEKNRAILFRLRTVEGVNDQSTHYRYLNIKILFINKCTCSCHLTTWKL